MNERQRRALGMPLFVAMFIAGFLATVLALARRSLPLMLLALALPALAGIALFTVVQRDRKAGPPRSWPPPGTRI